ncbi:CAZyme family CE4 [Paecilomyces variotii]|nr:CAZyme family CE4 [Paecilomyces variotii]
MSIIRIATLITLAFSPLSLASPTLDDQNQTLAKRSPVPFGVYIERCNIPGTIALTFDDGPHVFTPKVLDTLRSRGARATFFVNGQSTGNIHANAGVVQRAIAEGHQIGSHTWSHPSLAGLDYNAIIDQMLALEGAFMQIIGRIPTYMRPPFLAVDGAVLAAMGQLGYHVIGASIDTKDYENDNPAAIQNSLVRFRDQLNAGGTISLAHDVRQWTVEVLVQAMIDEVSARGLRMVPVGECLGDPADLWYRGPR